MYYLQHSCTPLVAQIKHRVAQEEAQLSCATFLFCPLTCPFVLALVSLPEKIIGIILVSLLDRIRLNKRTDYILSSILNHEFGPLVLLVIHILYYYKRKG
jgi:hypothetical protein